MNGKAVIGSSAPRKLHFPAPLSHGGVARWLRQGTISHIAGLQNYTLSRTEDAIHAD